MAAIELKNLVFFVGLEPKRLAKDLEHLQPFTVGAGEVLVQQGDLDDALLMVLDGEVSIEVGQPALEVARAVKSEIIGETALFRPAWRREATLRTATTCTVVVLGGASIAALRTGGSPMLAALERAALHSLGRRLRRVALQAPTEVLAPPPPQAPPSLGMRIKRWFSGRPEGHCPQPDTASVLARTLPDLSPAELQRLVPAFEALEVPTDYGLPTDALPGPPLRIVASGVFELRDPRGDADQQRVLARIGAGEMIEPATLVHGNTCTSLPVCAQQGWILQLDRDAATALLKEASATGHALRRAVYESMITDLIHRNTAWHKRWVEKAA